MNTTENNKLLAEFMNYANSRPITDSLANSLYKDYNSLMSVAEKIETVETKDGRTFTIDMHRDSVLIFEYGLTTNEIVFTEGKGRLENLYNACIEFVKWWNKEQIE